MIYYYASSYHVNGVIKVRFARIDQLSGLQRGLRREDPYAHGLEAVRRVRGWNTLPKARRARRQSFPHQLQAKLLALIDLHVHDKVVLAVVLQSIVTVREGNFLTLATAESAFPRENVEALKLVDDAILLELLHRGLGF